MRSLYHNVVVPLGTKGGSAQRGEELVHPESMGGNSWKKAQAETRRKTLTPTAILLTF